MVDHRRLGRELDLFDSDPLIGAGLPFWLPAGAAARHAVEEYVRELERRAGYQHVHSPALGKRQMYELSGHWEHYRQDMFAPIDDNDQLVLRPSNCPHHALIFKARQRSYRDLPLRIAELGSMYRAERSGVLGGLNRVRAINLNDAHIFCAPDQVVDEVASVLRLMRRAFAALGFEPKRYRLSLPANGDDAPELEEALRAESLSYVEERGEAAFYGPKIDVQVEDAAGRESSISTVQLDFFQPRRFGLEYADASGGRQRPVMVHRSLVGSMERLFGHLIEVHQGAFPLWYAPVQLAVLPVSDDQAVEANAAVRRAVEHDLRAEAHHEGSIGARIRHAAARKVPYVGVIGAREAAAGLIALRRRDGRQLPPMPIAEAIALIDGKAAAREGRENLG
nr:threonine--tRNA ligase [uncultured Actinoplanes sp.]